MINIINSENRHLFRHALMDMHHQRKSIFMDEMKWPLAAPEGFEIDAFDGEDTTYLIDSAGPRAPVSASVRLLRTDGPHLLGDVFAHLCPDGVPRASTIWEASRFCPSPEAPRRQRPALLELMIAGIMETALLFGVERVTFVAGAALAPVALRAGWRAAPLGPSVRQERDRVTAIVAEIDLEGLARVRARARVGAPVTRFTSGDMRRAA